MKTKLSLLILILLAAGCSRWKVSDLKPDLMLQIKSGYAPSRVSLEFEEGDIFNVTFNLKVTERNVYCADNIARKLMIFDRSGTHRLTIGQKPVAGNTDNLVPFEFSSIGLIAEGSDESIFVQNRLKIVGGGDQDIAPSYVLKFSSEGKLEATFGQDGVTNAPFYYIEGLHADRSGRLFVIGRTFETWGVYRFNGRARDYYASFDKDSFRSFASDPKHTPVIETAHPFQSGDGVLFAVAFYDGTRFKYRKVIEMKIGSKTMRKILELPDPRNELFTIMDDRYLLFWEVDDRDVRFVIWSFQENIVNSFRLNPDQGKSFYEQVLCDEAGKIYSYSVRRDGIRLYQWE